MLWPLIDPPVTSWAASRCRQAAVDVAAVLDGRSFEAEEAADQRIAVEVVDRCRAHRGEKLAGLHRLQHRAAGTVAQFDPTDAARTIEPRNTVSKKLAQRGVACRLLVDGVDHGGVVLIARPVVWEQPTQPRRSPVRVRSRLQVQMLTLEEGRCAFSCNTLDVVTSRSAGSSKRHRTPSGASTRSTAYQRRR
jgi:hypothetical protein